MHLKVGCLVFSSTLKYNISTINPYHTHNRFSINYRLYILKSHYTTTTIQSHTYSHLIEKKPGSNYAKTIP